MPISSGQTGLGDIAEFSQEGNAVSWRFPERFLTVHFELIGESLSVEYVQDMPISDTVRLTWPIVGDFQSLRGYIFPFFEGSYVPKNYERWQDFLIERGPIDTTAGLSMPFWGLDLGDRTLTYILTNPFNNQIVFSKTSTSGLGIKVSHAFTPNWERKTYGLRISFGTASPVAPAKQYRRYVMENAEFVSFAEKIQKNPAAEKLLGAAHAYLWGGKLLSQYDVTDWKAFATGLSDDSEIARQIWTQLNAEAREAVQDIAQSERPFKYSLRVVSRALSEQLEKPGFYNATTWAGVSVTPEIEALISRDVSTLSSPEIYRRNCLLLYAAFPNVLRHPDEWGDGLSVKLTGTVCRKWIGQTLARCRFMAGWVSASNCCCEGERTRLFDWTL